MRPTVATIIISTTPTSLPGPHLYEVKHQQPGRFQGLYTPGEPGTSVRIQFQVPSVTGELSPLRMRPLAVTMRKGDVASFR